ncbi:MAG: MAPEG family protein [Pseudomonadota bacterium]
MAPITALYAAPIALIFLWLSTRVILARRDEKIGLGDGGNKSLMKRMRAQANCAEYAPIGILLIGLVEINGGPALLIHMLGLSLLAGRALHAWGFSASPPVMIGRQIGMVLTALSIASAAIALPFLAVS